MSHKHFDPARLAKVERLRRLERPRVVDLFSGCGGLSLGFHRAEFDIVGNVEFDAHAAAAHARNFHSGDPRHSKPRDITKMEPGDVFRDLGFADEAPELVTDVIIGGPPCQAYTRIGRAKLRKVREHPEAHLEDPRGSLYHRYLHYVQAMKPLAVVMENVPDSLNYGGLNIPQEVADSLGKWGYSCRYTLVNAIHYGVPQYRERMILIALAPELEALPLFPVPTHWEELPEGYRQHRRGLIGDKLQLSLLEPSAVGLLGRNIVPPPRPSARLELDPPVTAHQALGNLPRVDPRRPRISEPVSYPELQPGYDAEMRNWPGFEAGPHVENHFTRSQPRDYPIFKIMDPGDQYPQAHKKAIQRFKEWLKAEYGEAASAEGSPQWNAFMRSFVPPYDPDKFPNKWRKMERNKPARTLMAHLGKDTYSHIHYDDDQARTITVREAARLQSFPDGFWFPPSMNAAYRMIGNAVPPLLSYAIARQLDETLTEAVARVPTVHI